VVAPAKLRAPSENIASYNPHVDRGWWAADQKSPLHVAQDRNFPVSQVLSSRQRDGKVAPAAVAAARIRDITW
jgi:hypothetical protein